MSILRVEMSLRITYLFIFGCNSVAVIPVKYENLSTDHTDVFREVDVSINNWDMINGKLVPLKRKRHDFVKSRAKYCISAPRHAATCRSYTHVLHGPYRI